MFLARVKLFTASLPLVGVTLIALLVGRQPATARPASQSPASAAKTWGNFLYDKSSVCMRCHAAPDAEAIKNESTEFVLLTESAVWRTHDKHAQAFAVLQGQRGKQMEELLRERVLDPKTGCLSCHAMYNLLDQSRANAEPEKEREKARMEFLMDGVSCAGCHGPSSKVTGKEGPDSWREEHQNRGWRLLGPDAKFQRGMRDLRDPLIRAELCMSCHIGNVDEGKVVTHAMMAAGHPPLPAIDIATFSKNQPRHWREVGHVPWLNANRNARLRGVKDQQLSLTVAEGYGLKYGYGQTRLALVGNVVAAREIMKLVRDRALAKVPHPFRDRIWPELAQIPQLGTDPRQRWPELAMAHSDCFACHHDLAVPGYRQKRGYGYHVPGLEIAQVHPGRPMVRSWPLAGLVAATAYLEDAAELNRQLVEALNALVKETNAQPFGVPENIGNAAGRLADWCDVLLDKLHQAEFSRQKVRRLALTLCQLYDSAKESGAGLPDYETARQIGSILRVACLELSMGDKEPGGELTRTHLGDLAKYLNLEPYIKRESRLEYMRDVIWSSLAGKKPDQLQFNEAFSGFKNYLVKLGNEEGISKGDHEGLIDNLFLTRLGTSVANQDFTTALVNKKNDLQLLSDDEQAVVLRVVASYQPGQFLKLLERLKQDVTKSE